MADAPDTTKEQEEEKQDEERKDDEHKDEPKGDAPSNVKKLLLFAGAFVLSFVVIFGVMLLVAYKFLPDEFGLVAQTEVSTEGGETEASAEGAEEQGDDVELLESDIEEGSLEEMQREIDSIAASLEEMDEDLDPLGKMTEQLLQKDRELAEKKRELEEQQEEVERLRKLLDAQAVKRSEEEQKRVKRLAKIFEAMEPEQAAPILDNLEDGTIIDILLLAKEREAANILGAIDPGRAAMISNKIRTP